MARKPSDTVQLKLRFPEALRRRLEREARRHGQSLNREIVSILEERFRESDDADRRAAAFAEALRYEFMRLYREDKARGQATGANQPPLLGEPIRKHEVIPLNNPVPETPEPKVPLPQRQPKPVPLREKELQFSISSSWTATPSPKTEDGGEKK